MRTLQEAIDKMREQLTWRGPTGRTLNHVVLERELAQLVYEALTNRGHHEDQARGC